MFWIKLKKAGFFSFLLYFFIVSYGYASVSVELTIDRPSAVLADTIVLKVSVIGSKSSSLPKVSGIEAFDVVRGGTSSKFQIINGETSSGIDYTFYLHPLKQGNFEIGPATVEIDGEIIASNKVNLIVEKNNVIQNSKQTEPLFIKASVSHDILFVNQQAVYSVKFFRLRQVSDLSFEAPESEGVTFESLTEPREYSSIIDGKRYAVIELTYVMTTKNAGEFTIPPSRMKMTVYDRTRQDGFFQDPFFSMSAGRPVYLASNEVKVKVNDLPVENRPSYFTGLVGNFTMESSIEPDQIKIHDSITLTVNVKGIGNIRQIPDLKIEDIDGVKVYQDKPVLDIQKNVSAVTGTKTMKWAIVPEKAGEVEIPAFFLSYFDPAKQAYIELKTEPMLINVAAAPEKDRSSLSTDIPVKNADPEISVNGRKKQVTRIGRDIFPVHTVRDPLTVLHAHHFLKWLFILCTAAPVAVFFGLLIIIAFKQKKAVNSDVVKSKNACRVLMRRLKREDLSSQEIHSAVIEYINNRFFLKGGVITPDEAAKILSEKGVSMETSRGLQENMKQLETVIFAGISKENSGLGIQNKLIHTVESIEKEVK
jgi:hypothetical protein